MARDSEEPRNIHRAVVSGSALHRFSSGFTLLFTLFSLTPATPRRASGEPQDGSSPETSSRILRKLVLALTFLFVILALAASSSLVIYTAWIHDLENGLFALAFAILSAQIAMNWLRWKHEEDPAE